MRQVACLALVLGMTGCSVIFDTGEYRGSGTDGGMSDPDASMTGDGSTADGGAGDGSTGNRPPTLAYAALASYDVFIDERLRAMSGPTNDADGDPVTLEYAWFADGERLDANRRILTDLPEAGIQPGQQVRLEVTPTDGKDEGETVQVGPITIRPVATSWRALQPSGGGNGVLTTMLDMDNARILLVQNRLLWEFRFDESNQRWARLSPKGEIPPRLLNPSIIRDPRHDRFLLFGGIEVQQEALSGAVWQLDVSTRGGERWRDVTPQGPSPSARVFATTLYDREGQRALVYGGSAFEENQPPFDDLWVLDLSEPDSVQWQPVDTDGGPSGVLGSTWLLDRERDRALLLGGTQWLGDDYAPGDEVWELDLDTLEFAGPSATTPAPTSFPGAFVHPANRERAIVFHGIRGFDSSGVQDRIWMLDLANLEFTEMQPEGEPPPPSVLSGARYDPYGERVIVSLRARQDDPKFSVWAFDPNAEQWSPIHQYGVDQPPVLTQSAFGPGPNGPTLYFGRDETRSAHAGIWRWQGHSDWTHPDIVDGPDGAPEPRYGHAMPRWTPGQGRTLIYGGVRQDDAGNRTLLRDAWRVRNGRWLKLGDDSGSAPRAVGATAWTPWCGGHDLTIHGGETSSSGALSQDTYMHVCSDSGNTCAWRVYEDRSEPQPPPAAFATSVAGRLPPETEPYVIRFGGRGSSGPLRDVWRIPRCGVVGTARWEDVSPPLDTAPPARFGHSMHPLEDPDRRELKTLFVFGGASTRGDGEMNDVWALDIDPSDGTLSWRSIRPDNAWPYPSPRVHHAAFFERARGRIVVYGGAQDGNELGDLWELRIAEEDL